MTTPLRQDTTREETERFPNAPTPDAAPKSRVVAEFKHTPDGLGCAISLEHKVARKWSAVRTAHWFAPGPDTARLVALLLGAAERGDLALEAPTDCPDCTPYRP